MKIQVVSDLHHEWLRARGEDIRFHFSVAHEADVIVLAGDIDNDIQAADFIAWLCGLGKQVVYVLGNHEGYSGVEWRSIESRFKEFSDKLPNFHFLNRSSTVIGNVEFIGATLWTSGDLAECGTSMVSAASEAQRCMNDFRLIRMDKAPLTFKKSNDEHRKDIQYIDIALSNSRAEKKVVVCHHLPSAKSIAEQYKGSLLNAAFASDVPEDIITKADVFIHGHTHSSCDYYIESTRVVCNPRGYPKRGGGYENSDFTPQKVIDV